MKKTVLFSLIIIVIAALLPACAFMQTRVVRGSGAVTTETRSVSGFDRIVITGSADVEVSFGDTESVVVEAEDNLLPLITTEVNGRTLEIGVRLNTSINPTRPIRVAVTMKSLDGATISGSGSFDIPDLQADKVSFDITGSGSIVASGTAETVDATVSGSGSIDCGDVRAATADAKITGSGDVTVYASEKLQALVSGSGNITYRGDPAEVEESITGSGSVRPD